MIDNVLRVLIVGCGNIAGIFDLNRSAADFPLTHAGAFSRDDRFSISACVEPDTDRRKEFMAAWHVPKGFGSIDEIVGADVQFDIVSICSPTVNHAQDIEHILQLQPRLIFCEKPVTSSLSETEKIVEKCNASNIPLAINYTRRWDPDVVKYQKDISAGDWGELRSITGIYNKGILNNGSHMLDLLHLLVGQIEIVMAGDPIDDYFTNDPSVPVWLKGAGGVPITITCGHAKDYSLFELQLVFSGGVLTMEEGGMFWCERRVENSNTFSGYKKLSEGVRRNGQYPLAMSKAVDNIYHALIHNQKLASTGESAVITQRLCEQIRELACN